MTHGMKSLGMAGVLAAALAGPAMAETGAQCVTEMVRAETEARVALERGIADLVAEASPERAEIAGIARDLQIAVARDRLARIEYLAEARPEAFEGETGEVAWTEADAAGFSEVEGTEARIEKINALNEEAAGHPQAEGLQKFFRGSIVRMPRFQELMVAHNEARGEAAETFTACKG